MSTDYGTTTWCLDSLRTGRHVSGVRAVAQICYHRLITPRSDLRGGPDEGNFGLDLEGMCGATLVASSEDRAALEAAMPARIENELRKDERVESVRVRQSSSKDGDGDVTWTFDIRVTTGLGPFSLVIGVDKVGVKLLNLSAP